MEDTEDPIGGLLPRRHGWVEGEVEYQGQNARIVVYFSKFKDGAIK